MIVVDIALATICFFQNGAQVCHNALVGPQTPRGQFSLIQRLTEDPGYGGDVLQFKETERDAFSIHRIWKLRPHEQRERRILSANPDDRRSITQGCVNVSDAVYDEIVKCCLSHSLIIR